jgi:hypothetical protein
MPRYASQMAAYSSAYLNAEDLKGQRYTAIVSSVAQEIVGQDVNPKLVISLASTTGKPWPKTFVLNRTNKDALSDACGDDIDQWPGAEVTVYTVRTQNRQGQPVQGLRLDVVSPARRASGNGMAYPPQGTFPAGAPASPPAMPQAPPQPPMLPPAPSSMPPAMPPAAASRAPAGDGRYLPLEQGMPGEELDDEVPF